MTGGRFSILPNKKGGVGKLAYNPNYVCRLGGMKQPRVLLGRELALDATSKIAI